MVDEVYKELEKLLPEYKYMIYRSIICIAEKDSGHNEWFCMVDLHRDRSSSFHYDAFYDIANPDFSFENLACDVVLTHLFYKEHERDTWFLIK